MDILSGSISGKIHLFRRKPNRAFAEGITLNHASGETINVGRGSAVTTIDWDGDGDLDLVIGNGDGQVYLVRNIGTRQKPTCGPAERLMAGGQYVAAPGGNAGPCIADWDGDGLFDLLLGAADGSVAWHPNAGKVGEPRLAAPVTLVTAMPVSAREDRNAFDRPVRSAWNSKVFVTDWNGDEQPDLLVGDYFSQRVQDTWKFHGYVWVYLRQASSPAEEPMPLEPRPIAAYSQRMMERYGSIGRPASAPAAEPKDPVLVEDSFNSRLGEGWSWLREEAQRWRIREGALEIRLEPGDARTVRNALIRPAPDRAEGRFAIEVTVTNLEKPTQQYEQAGITWYVNGEPVFKLVKELVDGQLMIIPGRKPMDSESVRLRLVVSKDTYTAQFQPNAQGEFLTAATGGLPAPNQDQVSLQGYHGPADAEHWVRFDDFRILKILKGPE